MLGISCCIVQIQNGFFGGSTVHGGSPDIITQDSRIWWVKSIKEVIDLVDHRLILTISTNRRVNSIDFDRWVIYTGHNDLGTLFFSTI